MQSDLAIARAAALRPIPEVASTLGVPEAALHPYGRHIAKLDSRFVASLRGRPKGKLILVTAINPTPAGEGKTTTTIGLGDALNRIGKRTAICLREPSLGPCFGQKGGAAGGGHAQVVPMEQINLHFTGDFHAIGAANNLLAAMIDNHLYWGNALGIDSRRITWRRALDMNDRALRSTVASLGGAANGFPREDGFDITVATEVMASFCLARDLQDLEARLARTIVASSWTRKPVTAKDLKADGAMAVLLRDALQPNLVQTLEGSPALVHGGPFANIAHGCNSVIATEAALALADHVVTEAGFGADLGAEKFLNIKCRTTGLAPAATVIVATVRALKMHGGVAKSDLDRENLDALRRGLANLERHIVNMRDFGPPVVVAVNHFASDSEAEHALVRDTCKKSYGVAAITCRHWAEGAPGAEDLARTVAALVEGPVPALRLTYPDEAPLREKIQAVAVRIYGAGEVAFDAKALQRLSEIEAAGFAHLPVCFAKTQYSFSADPSLLGAPTGHVVPVRDVRLSAGAGFVVVLCGDILRMPGLPRAPAAERIRLDAAGEIEGLF